MRCWAHGESAVAGGDARSRRRGARRLAGRGDTGKITVYNASGSALDAKASGLAANDKARLRATFAKNLPAGLYSVRWRALADDGHHEKGTFHFRVRGSGS
jgi:hypothetical protein